MIKSAIFRPLVLLTLCSPLLSSVAQARSPAQTQATGPADADDFAAAKDRELSPAQLFDQAKSYLQRMQVTIRRSEKKKEVALLIKDLIKVNCLNEKLSQSQSHIKTAQEAVSILSEAIIDGDAAARLHEMSRLRILYRKVIVLAAEAEDCASEDASYVGPSQVEVEIDASVPAGDPTDPGLPVPTFTLLPPGIEEAVPDSEITPAAMNASGLTGRSSASAASAASSSAGRPTASSARSSAAASPSSARSRGWKLLGYLGIVPQR